MKPCHDVPEQLWISDAPLSRPTGNASRHARKLVWTAALLEVVRRRREEGKSWPAIAQEIAQRTGVSLSARRIAECFDGEA